ncbi:hypothetical protein [Streptomyces sp. NPDC021212]|uniref:hypothetical protein n=1 Tax=Streptomyces sp. NPDC021212 TaxID=3365118 RepID=UPI00378F079D
MASAIGGCFRRTERLLHPFEPRRGWTTEAEPVSASSAAYHSYLGQLRVQYGRAPYIVVTAARLSNTTASADTAQRIVMDRNARGDNRIGYWHCDDPSLDRLGCDWSPSSRDHQIIARLLGDHLASLPLRW